jgi:hypothetical membrane protein
VPVSCTPRWGLLSSGAAPVLLVGGWTVAAGVQPDGFDAARDTISALAGRGAGSRWVMTAALIGVGTCHVTTAAALRGAATAGRVVLASGGVATVGLALAPLPSGGGGSAVHTVAAGIAFAALAAWPALSWRRGSVPAALRPAAALAATATLAGLVGWFALELTTDGRHLGLAERAAAGAQAVWPLVAVVASRRHDGR